MDASSISDLTARQLDGVAMAATAHRPDSLLDVIATSRHVHIEAISCDGRATFGEWDLELRDRKMVIRVVIDDTLYVEVVKEMAPLYWDCVLNGLRMWGKAVNAVELRRALSDQPEMAHLIADHLISPDEYSPLGGPLI